MEWAIHISGASEVCATLNPAEVDQFGLGLKLQPTIKLAAELVEQYFGSVTFTRCVYGNEFCENLIPSPERLKDAIEAAREKNLKFTLVTPYVSDAGIKLLRPLFDLLSRDGTGNEVVFNDWGVLNLLKRDYSGLIPVQGRLMNKSLRDPRITGVYAANVEEGTALVTLRGSNADCGSYQDLLLRMGVSTIELDNLPQGIDLTFAGSRVNTSIYMPFGFISTSRVCMAAGIHYRKQDKFQPGASCQHECQTHLLEYTYTNSPFGNNDQKFLLKGNTYFYSHTEAMLRSLFEKALKGLVNRIVFQPRLPMTGERTTRRTSED
ncbi:MAG: hypothetical protein ACLGJB_19535 [Blastocatellia bacterium]